MATCKNHPDRDARTTCTSCGVDLCEECVAPGEGDNLCFDCSISSTGQGLAKKQAQDAARPAPKPPQRRVSRGMRALVACGAVIVAAELAIIFLMKPQATQTLAPSALDAQKNATAETAADVMMVSEGLEEHRREHGRYPDNLSDLAEYLPEDLIKRLRDPSTSYELDTQGGYLVRISAGSPHPVSATSKSPVPRVEGVTP